MTEHNDYLEEEARRYGNRDWGCNKRGCPRGRIVTIRLESDDGAKFFALCRKHIRDAANVINMLADSLEKEEEDDRTLQ